MLPLVIGVLYLLPFVHSCSFVPGGEPPRYTKQELVAMAPITVSAKVTAVDDTDLTEDYENCCTAEVQVICVYKANGSIPEDLVINNGVKRNSCQSRDLKVNATYMLTLKKADNGRYDIYENAMSWGQWMQTSDAQQETLGVCGVEPRNPGDDSSATDMCPVHQSVEPCFELGAASFLSPHLMSLVATLFFVFTLS